MPRFILMLLLLAMVSAAVAEKAYVNDSIRRLLDEKGDPQWLLLDASHEEHRLLGHGLKLKLQHRTLPVEISITSFNGRVSTTHVFVRTEKDDPYDETAAVDKAVAVVSRIFGYEGFGEWIREVKPDAIAGEAVFGSGKFDGWTVFVGRKNGIRTIAMTHHDKN